MSKKIELITATTKDIPVIKELYKFYLYDISKYYKTVMYFNKKNELEIQDIKFNKYFEEEDCKCILIKYNSFIAGFILLNHIGTSDYIDWNLKDFFIFGPLQNKGIGTKAVQLMWNDYPGKWEVAIHIDNLPAINFWKKAFKKFCKNKINQSFKVFTSNKINTKKCLLSSEVQ